MEPVSSVAVAIASLVLTKVFEKTGEILGETVIEKSTNLAQLLKNQSKRTATVIEQAEQHPWNYGQAVLEEVEAAAFADWEIAEAVKEVEVAAMEDPTIGHAVQSVKNAIRLERSIAQNFAKLAQKAGAIDIGSACNP